MVAAHHEIERPRTQTRRAVRVAMFVGLTVAAFFASLLVSANVRYGGHSLLQYFTRNTLAPGGQYHSLRRFRELADRGRVSVVFFGSSHGYRGFDPRIFAAEGHETYNLSSTNQTPLNGYFLASRYLPELSPELVVIEVYYGTLANDGFESYRDLAVNTPASWPMMRMALATRHASAVTFSIAKALGLVAAESRAEQQDVEGETYVPGGYVETRGRRTSRIDREPFSIVVRPEHLEYLEDTADLARAIGARVVWVTHPLPEDHRRAFANYADVRALVRASAARCGVEYWDYDERLSLDPLEDFSDFHHLSASGALKFDRALLEDLWSSGYLRRKVP